MNWLRLNLVLDWEYGAGRVVIYNLPQVTQVGRPIWKCSPRLLDITRLFIMWRHFRSKYLCYGYALYTSIVYDLFCLENSWTIFDSDLSEMCLCRRVYINVPWHLLWQYWWWRHSMIFLFWYYPNRVGKALPEIILDPI